tara:strand:- start:764 stop:1414 length:651 start_codon:yes stop_codon:yes gene_type:complete
MVLLIGCKPEVPVPAIEDQSAAKAELAGATNAVEERDAMVRVLALDTEQSAAVGEAFEARDAAVGQWLSGEAGQRLIVLEAKMSVAARSKDLSGVKEAISEAEPLREELRGVIDDHESAIRAVLTPTQRNQWDGYQLASKMLEVMEPLHLAADQTAAIQEGAPRAVAQAQAQGEAYPKAAAYLELENWVVSQLLTEVQARAFNDVKAQHPLSSLTF